jgi:glycosyltransferase involved in cell wall biosynthesis
MQDGAHPSRVEDLVGSGRRSDLVWAGRMMPRKGCALAVEAFALARPRLPSHVRFLVVGDGSERPAVERAVARDGLAGRVELIGSVPHSEIVSAIAGARALIFSSLRDTFGGVVLEASEQATPTVWASHPGVDGLRTWFPSDAGWTRPVSDAKGFVNALADGMVAACTAEEAEWSARSRSAFRFADRNSWSVRGDEIGDLYRRLNGGGL